MSDREKIEEFRSWLRERAIVNLRKLLEPTEAVFKIRYYDEILREADDKLTQLFPEDENEKD